MLTPMEFQDGAGLQDVFHTPPEEYSLHSSEEQRPVVDVDVGVCAVNQVVEVDDGSQAFVDFGEYSVESEFADLGKDSDLGLLERQVIDAEVAADVEGDRVSGVDYKRKVDEIKVSESDLSDSGEFPVKKLKSSEHDLGFGSSGDFLVAESEKSGEAEENRKGELVSASETETPSDLYADFEPEENVVDGEKNLGSDSETETLSEPEKDVLYGEKNFGSDGENVETGEDVQAEIKGNAEAGKSPCAAEENKSCEEVQEASGTKEESDGEAKLRVLPSSVSSVTYREEKRLEPEEGKVKEKSNPFKILKFLAEDKEEVETISTVELLRRARVPFPCPRWWPENYESLGYFNISGLLLIRDHSWRE